eukprot:1137002-Pelagomonas_calceolata.AAC.3
MEGRLLQHKCTHSHAAVHTAKPLGAQQGHEKTCLIIHRRTLTCGCGGEVGRGVALPLGGHDGRGRCRINLKYNLLI